MNNIREDAFRALVEGAKIADPPYRDMFEMTGVGDDAQLLVRGHDVSKYVQVGGYFDEYLNRNMLSLLVLGMYGRQDKATDENGNINHRLVQADLHQVVRHREEQIARERRQNAVVQSIKHAVQSFGATCTHDRGEWMVNGVNVQYYLSIDDDKIYTGQPVARRGDRTRYPMRKDGSFNFKAIASDLIRIAHRLKERNAVENAVKQHDVIAKALIEKLAVAGVINDRNFGKISIEPTPDPAAPIRVSIRLQQTFATAEEAEAFVCSIAAKENV